MKVQIALLVLVLGAVTAKPSFKPKPNKYDPWFINRPPGRIVGGEEATRFEFPWIVDMRQGGHYCGGTIYNNEWVVTAAHCSLGSPSAYTLTAGDHNIDVVGDDQEQKRQVTTIIVHPNYGSGVQYENDIALMKVSPPFVFNEFVQPATMAPPGYGDTARAIVAGWGALTEGGSSPSRLMKVDVPVVSDANCRLAYGETRISDSMICSGEAGKDSCQGDSGGPMTCNNGTGVVLCGIVSWGSGCARPGFPGVYTETSYFTEWIAAAITPPPEDNSTWVEQSEGCGGVLVGSSGRLSYKLGQSVEGGERCVWTIRTNSRSSVRAKILQNGFGMGDTLSVTELFGDGSASATTVLGDEEVVFSGVILVTFRAGANSMGQGFSLEFYGTGFPDTSTSRYTHLHLNATVGTLNYPVGGGNYQPDEYATIVINPAGRNPTLKVDRLDIENAPSCQYDSMNILNFNTDNYNYVGKYCQTPLPAPVVANDGVIVLVFTTDDSVQASGFGVSWA